MARRSTGSGVDNSTRKIKWLRTKKDQTTKGYGCHYICEDGPLKGQTIYVCSDYTTAVFTVNGQTGYYEKGRWVPQKEK